MEETAKQHERNLDRELNELLQELRVIQGGILLLVGFLLVIAFSARFAEVNSFQKATYYATFIVTGTAAIVVVAPVVHHRMAFRQRDKERVLTRGNLEVLISIVLLSFSVLGILVLITDVLYPTWVTVLFGSLYVGLVGILWGLLPLTSVRAARKGR